MTTLGRFLAVAAAFFLTTLLGGCLGDSRDTSTPPQPSAPSLEPPSSADLPAPPTKTRQPAPQPAEDAAARIPSAQIRTLAIYRFDPLHGRLSVRSTVEVPADSGRDSALETLLAHVNAQLTGRRIESLGLRKDGQREILILNLVDLGEGLASASWYSEFQGSAGGAATQAFLVATFLQQQYGGEWFDGVQFLFNGQAMTEMDHVDLSGVFLRRTDLAQYVPVPMTGPGDLTDEEISSFLRNTLDLPEETRFTLARLRIRNGVERIVFFALRLDMMARRGVVRVTDGLPQILTFEDDPCYCFDVQAEAVELVGGQGEFVVTRFSPLTGSCVGLEVVRILALGEDEALVEVWRGTTFEASGTESRIASVEFADLDGDGDLEIVRSGKLIDCGEECLCREGPVIETFETVYDWSADSGRFQEVR